MDGACRDVWGASIITIVTSARVRCRRTNGLTQPERCFFTKVHGRLGCRRRRCRRSTVGSAICVVRGAPEKGRAVVSDVLEASEQKVELVKRHHPLAVGLSASSLSSLSSSSSSSSSCVCRALQVQTQTHDDEGVRVVSRSACHSLAMTAKVGRGVRLAESRRGRTLSQPSWR
jgi:hypothetical protein